ncbi:MAG: bifunctional diguanylate cyclase/phosphodiesterase [Gammaproteobacteria bacterium]|nr:bifunctional diguanylate cyclase/phosphodiesterase [Gammaproteobacteria bacterium]
MTLRQKALLVVGMSILIFVGLAFSHSIQNSLLVFSSLGLVFFLLICFEMYYFMSKQNKDFIQQLKIVENENSTHQKEIENDLEKKIQSFKNKVEELQEKNVLLQQEVNTQVIVEKKSTIDNDYLAQMARYDDLTSLPNRVFFNEILNKSISHAKRHEQLLAILHIDLDSFGKIDKDIVASKSNLILKEMSKRFVSALRSEDILAKLDGEEFIVLLTDIKKSKFSGMVARKLLEACAVPLKIDNDEFNVTASIGICIYPNDGDSLEGLLKNVHEALFKAKHIGGNAYQFSTHEMDVEAREYIQLESALRKALHNNELTLYYQPKLSIQKGHIIGVETLMRWEHPVLGIINPAKFIPLAEESGLIMKIGEWALQEACQRNKTWQNEGYVHLIISVKLSTHQFHHPDIAKIIEKVLKETGLNPKYLELEIAENTVMHNIDQASTILETLKKIGVQICIDHFGTGYTSISFLKKFPINFIKIDKDFIKGVPNTPNDSAIVSAIIALAHNLGLGVVAEGVETAEQVQFLANNQCDIIQGYFLSHPVSAQKIQLQLTKLKDEVLI